MNTTNIHSVERIVIEPTRGAFHGGEVTSIVIFHKSDDGKTLNKVNLSLFSDKELKVTAQADATVTQSMDVEQLGSVRWDVLVSAAKRGAQ